MAIYRFKSWAIYHSKYALNITKIVITNLQNEKIGNNQEIAH